MRAITLYQILWLVLICSLLAGCGAAPAASSPTVAAPPTAPSAPPSPTVAKPPSPTPAEPSAATSATAAPLATPHAAAAPRSVDRLALDQPWLWTQTSACQYHGGMVLAVSASGDLQQLQAPVLAVVERRALPPLLVTCPADDQYALVDTATWAATPFTLPAAALMQGFLASPDGTMVAFSTALQSGDTSAYSLAIVDSKTGQLRTLIDGADLLGSTSVHYSGDLIAPIAWSGQTLYVNIQSSASSAFWAIDVAGPAPQPREVLWVGEAGPWAMAPDTSALIWSASGQPLYLRDLSSDRDQLLRPAATAASNAVFSPDSHTLVLIDADASQHCCELRVYTLTNGPPQQLGAALKVADLASIQGRAGWEWSHDGQYLLAATRAQPDGPLQALLMRRDARAISSVPLPGAVIDDMRLLGGDHLSLIAREGARSVLRTLALDESAEPGIPAMVLPDIGADVAIYSFVHTP